PPQFILPPTSVFISVFVFPSSAPHRDLHSFPTRRSSDLSPPWPSTSRRASSSRLRARARSATQATSPSGPGSGERARSGGTSKRSEEHTSELQSRGHLVCRLLLEKKKHMKHHASRSQS